MSRDDIRLRLPARRHLELDGDRELALTGGGRRLVLRLDDGYRFSLVAPGGSYTARFTLLVEDVS